MRQNGPPRITVEARKRADGPTLAPDRPPMVLRAALLCAALALELGAAVVWDMFSARVMSELVALGACALVGVALFARCCCCRGAPPDARTARWASVIALLIVVEFVCAASAGHILFTAVSVLVPALVSPLGARTRSAGGAAVTVLALAIAGTAAAGTDALERIGEAASEGTSVLLLGLGCLVSLAAQWAVAQHVLERRPRARPSASARDDELDDEPPPPRIGPTALLAAVLVRASALIALGVLALFAVARLAKDAHTSDLAASLLERSPAAHEALEDIDAVALVDERCVRLPFGDVRCWDVPERLTRCVDLPLGLHFCASAHALTLAAVATALCVGMVCVLWARLALVGALGACSLASVCVLARLGRLGLAMLGLEPADEHATVLPETDRQRALCAAAATAATLQLLLALAEPPGRGRSDGAATPRGGAPATPRGTGRSSELLLEVGRTRSDEQRSDTPRSPRADAAAAMAAAEWAEFEQFKRWREMRDLREYEATRATRTAHPPLGRRDAAPPAYESVVVRSFGAADGGPERAPPTPPARWVSVLADDGETVALTCTRCGFSTCGDAAMQQHALHCAAPPIVLALDGAGGNRHPPPHWDADHQYEGAARRLQPLAAGVMAVRDFDRQGCQCHDGRRTAEPSLYV